MAAAPIFYYASITTNLLNVQNQILTFYATNIKKHHPETCNVNSGRVATYVGYWTLVVPQRYYFISSILVNAYIIGMWQPTFRTEWYRHETKKSHLSFFSYTFSIPKKTNFFSRKWQFLNGNKNGKCLELINTSLRITFSWFFKAQSNCTNMVLS